MGTIEIIQMRNSPLAFCRLMFLAYIIGCNGATLDPPQQATDVGFRSVGSQKDNTTSGSEFVIRDPWHSDDAILVRLDGDRLRMYELTRRDVMLAAEETRLVDSNEPLRTSNVIHNPLHGRLEQCLERYPEILLHITTTGEAIRLKDVGTVELWGVHPER